MLFSTSIFIYAFLPVALAGYFLLARLRSGSLSRLWLAVASLFFYGYWGPKYLLLIGLSIIVNYLLGTRSRAWSLPPAAPLDTAGYCC